MSHSRIDDCSRPVEYFDAFGCAWLWKEAFTDLEVSLCGWTFACWSKPLVCRLVPLLTLLQTESVRAVSFILAFADVR